MSKLSDERIAERVRSLGGQYVKTDAISRFWSKVNKDGPIKRPECDQCWEWIASKIGRGYGSYYISQEQPKILAHRHSWELHNGPIPADLWVLHRCDNPPCVNPSHLFLGTRSDNMKDAAAKGRICLVGKSRLTHCRSGHPYSQENTTRFADGWRVCRTCVKRRRAEVYARHRARVATRVMR